MKHSEILQAAKQLLIDKGWTQNTFARNAAGYHVSATHPNATCFCMIGALKAVNDNVTPWETLKYFKIDHIPDFNDTIGRTLDQVLQKFDEAIERAKNAEH